jgi:hypothetical protein
MQARGAVDVSQEAVLCEEAPEFGRQVAGFGEVEAGLAVEEVAGQAEAVAGAVEFCWEAVVAPGVLGPGSGPDRHDTPPGSGSGAGFQGRRAL